MPLYGNAFRIEPGLRRRGLTKFLELRGLKRTEWKWDCTNVGGEVCLDIRT